jgi:hypothetical protein
MNKGDKLVQTIQKTLEVNKQLLEKGDLNWHDFGTKFRYKLKKDGCVITEVMD